MTKSEQMNIVKIIPQPALRPRITRRGAFNPPKYAEYKKTLSLLVKCYHKESISKPCRLTVCFYMPIPNMSKKKTIDHENSPHYKKPDLDNLVKALKDALNGIAYEDDNIVGEIVAKKVYSSNPRIEYKINEIRV